MKTKKITSFISIVFSLLILFVIKFSLSSFVKDPDFDSDPNDLCANVSHAEDETALLYIAFRPNGGSYNIPYRNTGFESYIPYEDLRLGYQYPASSLVSGMTSYYCFVEVTTPNCSNWNYTVRMSELNGGGNGNFTIRVPKRDNLWDLNIKIKYYEKCSDGTYSNFNETLRYSYEYTFLGGLPTTAGETIDLTPSGVRSCDSFNTGGSPGGPGGGGGYLGDVLDEIENIQ